MTEPAFPSFTQVPARIPRPVWHAARGVSVLFAVSVAVALIIDPTRGLLFFWGVLVPVLPVLFFVAPGLWRNLCPLAASNQVPRLFGFTRGFTIPEKARGAIYLAGLALFFGLASARKVLFNTSGVATAALILGAMGLAFTGGLLFKGKSGWCSSICPLLPVQRMYGQTPFVPVRNSHCDPCVGCAKNCFDFNPPVALLADLYDEDKHYAGYRKLFVAAFPGFVFGFFADTQLSSRSAAGAFAAIALSVLLSLGSFFVLETFARVSAHKLTTLYAALALNIFYWFSFAKMGAAIFALTGRTLLPALATDALSAALLVLSGVWIWRTYQKERRFLQQANAPPASTRLGSGAARALKQHSAKSEKSPLVVLMPEKRRLVVEAGRSLLEVAEANQCAIESGCRMGICGADPVAVLEGMENLTPVGSDEKGTLERLGFAANTRMACCARVHGAVSIALKPEQPTEPRPPLTILGFQPNLLIEKVVVVGNGIAGVTAADYVKRYSPMASVNLVGRETHHLYNRMAITRLIYARSAMQGLYLLPESWYEKNQVTTWLNTHVDAIDRGAKKVLLKTGESLAYDSLILATGSRSWVPKIDGYGLAGSFVLREAEDAMSVRAYAQESASRLAVVAGGGLLGLEAAYALYKLGLTVLVLERAERLLPMQLDPAASEMLRTYLVSLGIHVLRGAECASVVGESRVENVVLKDGRKLACDVLLVCTGITPNIDLAKAAGIECKRGIVVDEYMRTSDPDVFACGDVAEYASSVQGLWTTAVDQAKVASVNAVGGPRLYQGTLPSTILKVAGIDLMSMGRFEATEPSETAIVVEDARSYRKIVLRNGVAVGGILIGHSTLAPLSSK
jgi:nitrite reductase (NADH) large subunit